MLLTCVRFYWNIPIPITTQPVPTKASTNNPPSHGDNHQPAEQSTNEIYSAVSSTITIEHLLDLLIDNYPGEIFIVSALSLCLIVLIC